MIRGPLRIVEGEVRVAEVVAARVAVSIRLDQVVAVLRMGVREGADRQLEVRAMLPRPEEEEEEVVVVVVVAVAVVFLND